MARRYPKEVHDFIAENVAGRTAKELAALVNDRFGLGVTESMMKSYKTNHKLKSGTPGGRPGGQPTELFPREVMEYILGNYKGVGPTKMAERLNASFGTAYTARQIKRLYGSRKLDSGITGRFQKGHEPPNKGKKGECAPGSEKTQFRKGNLPANTKPVGHERISQSGYVEVKVRMRPSRTDCNDNFVAKHRLIWEQLHGPIPEGSVVIFKDGNKRNFDPGNLALITKAQRLQMTRRGLFSSDPELTEVGIAIAKVQTAAFAVKKKARRKQAEVPEEEMP